MARAGFWQQTEGLSERLVRSDGGEEERGRLEGPTRGKDPRLEKVPSSLEWAKPPYPYMRPHKPVASPDNSALALAEVRQ